MKNPMLPPSLGPAATVNIPKMPPVSEPIGDAKYHAAKTGIPGITNNITAGKKLSLPSMDAAAKTKK